LATATTGLSPLPRVTAADSLIRFKRTVTAVAAGRPARAYLFVPLLS
jgi:hypothetical protein